MTQLRKICTFFIVHTESFPSSLLILTRRINLNDYKDWFDKSCGQVTTYNSRNRNPLHLFINKTQVIRVPDIKLACLSFEVLVTGEVAS